MIFVLNVLVYGLVLAAAAKLFFWMEDLAVHVEDKPGVLVLGGCLALVIGFIGVPFFYGLAWLTNPELSGNLRSSDLFMFLATAGGFFVYGFYRFLRVALLGVHDMEGIDDLVEVPNSALAGLFILGCTLLPTLVLSPVSGEFIQGIATLCLMFVCYYLGLKIVGGIKWAIVRFGFEDAYLAWGRFSWSLFGFAIVASYYAVIFGLAGQDSGLLSSIAVFFFSMIKGAGTFVLGFFW